MFEFQAIRKRVLQTVADAVREDLLHNTSGDVSARAPEDTIAITTHKAKFHKLDPQDVAIVTPDGDAVDALSLPTEDIEVHLHIYNSLRNVNAIVHTHSAYAVAFSMLGEVVPPMNIELVQCGAPIPVTSDAFPGSRLEGTKVVELLQRNTGLKVVLQRNHGMIAVGSTLQEAFEAAYNAEYGLRSFHLARQIGSPKPIHSRLQAELRRAYEM